MNENGVDMKTILRASMLPLLAVGCVTGTGVELQEIVGIWDVEQAEIIAEATATLNEDVVESGSTVTMDIGAAGDFTLSLEDEDGMIETIVGDLVVDGNDLDVTFGSRQFPGEIFVEDDRAVFRIQGGVSFDFDDDGEREPAELSMIMDRA